MDVGVKKMRICTVTLVLLVVLGLASGCTRVQQGAIVGGGLGAGGGAVWAHNKGKLDTAEGALVGFAAGGMVGALVGDMLDECADKDRLEKLQQQISDLEGKLAGKDKTIDDLKDEIARLKKELNSKQVQVTEENGQIRFTILNEVLFDSGKAGLKAEGKDVINDVASLIKDHYSDRTIGIEGHTDSDPIKNSGWKSNWELSAARSLTVLHFMSSEQDMNEEMMSAHAYSMYRPVASNDSEEGKKQNRRAVIVVMPPKDKIVTERK